METSIRLYHRRRRFVRASASASGQSRGWLLSIPKWKTEKKRPAGMYNWLFLLHQSGYGFTLFKHRLDVFRANFTSISVSHSSLQSENTEKRAKEPEQKKKFLWIFIFRLWWHEIHFFLDKCSMWTFGRISFSWRFCFSFFPVLSLALICCYFEYNAQFICALHCCLVSATKTTTAPTRTEQRRKIVGKSRRTKRSHESQISAR